MQAEAAAAQVAAGRGRRGPEPGRHLGGGGGVRDGPHRAAPQEADQHRHLGEGGPREELPAELEALLRGDHAAGRQPDHGEGGGAGVVLQPQTEGEAHQPPRLLHLRAAADRPGHDRARVGHARPVVGQRARRQFRVADHHGDVVAGVAVDSVQRHLVGPDVTPQQRDADVGVDARTQNSHRSFRRRHSHIQGTVGCHGDVGHDNGQRGDVGEHCASEPGRQRVTDDQFDWSLL